MAKRVTWIAAGVALAIGGTGAIAQDAPQRSQATEQAVAAKYLEARFTNGYWTRTLFQPDGKYQIWDSEQQYSWGEWWGEEKALCFISHDRRKACWRYRPMIDGVAYETVAPDGRGTVVARLYTPK